MLYKQEKGEMETQDIRGALNVQYLEVLKVSFPSFKGEIFLTNGKKKASESPTMRKNTILTVLRCFYVIITAGGRATVTNIGFVFISMLKKNIKLLCVD